MLGCTVVFPLKKLTEQGVMSTAWFLGAEGEGVKPEQSSCCCFLKQGVRGILEQENTRATFCLKREIKKRKKKHI